MRTAILESLRFHKQGLIEERDDFIPRANASIAKYKERWPTPVEESESTLSAERTGTQFSHYIKHIQTLNEPKIQSNATSISAVCQKILLPSPKLKPFEIEEEAQKAIAEEPIDKPNDQPSLTMTRSRRAGP